MKDCKDLNPTEVWALFYSVFPNYPFVDKSQKKQIRNKQMDLQNLIIIDEWVDSWLDLPENFDSAIFRGQGLGAPKVPSPIVYGVMSELLQESFDSFTSYIVISSDFRGFLANTHSIIYIGDNYKFFWYSRDSDKEFFDEENWGMDLSWIFFNLNGKRESEKEWYMFHRPKGDSSDMVDITDMICGSPPEFTFINWNKDNPLEVKEW